MHIIQSRCAGRAVHVFFFLLLLLVAAPALSAPSPRSIGFTGRLTASNGTPVPNGPYSVTLSLYDTETGGAPVWSEAATIQVTNGLFSTALGSVTPLPDTLDFSRAYFVGVKAGADPEMQPRLALQGVPYALYAHDLAYASVGPTELKVDANSLTAVSGGVATAEVVGQDYELIQHRGQEWVPAGGTWQSFTATRPAGIQSVGIAVRRPNTAPPTQARLELIEGEGPSGKVIGGGEGTLPPSVEMVGFEMDAPVLVETGKRYTVRLVDPPGDAEHLVDRANPYPGGRSSDENSDLYFHTKSLSGSLYVSGQGTFAGPLLIGPELEIDSGGYAAPPMGLTTEDNILNLDYNFRFTGLDTSKPGGALRIDGRVPDYPLFQFIARKPGSSSEPTVVGITQEGKVGVGVSRPLAPLHLPVEGLQIGNSTTAADNFHIRSDADPRGLRFYRGNAGSGTLLMSLLSNGNLVSNGNLGLGVADPENGLVVANAGGKGSSLANGLHLGIDTLNNAHAELVGGTPYIDFNNDNTSDYKARIVLAASDTLRIHATKVNVAGTLSKSAGSFRIDHPLDPENKYLSHSFVESPDMMNVYNGNVTLGADGKAEVTLPDWFEALNRDFRYQLTPIGGPGPGLFIETEIRGNRFSIAGGKPGLRVSWLVTGIRRDAYAEAHRIPVEEDKPAAEKGGILR